MFTLKCKNILEQRGFFSKNVGKTKLDGVKQVIWVELFRMKKNFCKKIKSIYMIKLTSGVASCHWDFINSLFGSSVGNRCHL